MTSLSAELGGFECRSFDFVFTFFFFCIGFQKRFFGRGFFFFCTHSVKSIWREGTDGCNWYGDDILTDLEHFLQLAAHVCMYIFDEWHGYRGHGWRKGWLFFFFLLF